MVIGNLYCALAGGERHTSLLSAMSLRISWDTQMLSEPICLDSEVLGTRLRKTCADWVVRVADALFLDMDWIRTGKY